MKRMLSPLMAVALGIGFGAVTAIPAAQVKDPPPPVYVGPTPAATPAVPEPAPVAPAPVAPAPPPSAPARKGAADLEKLAMPIALYPDPLLASILPAAAYPVEIVQAARFVKDTNNIPKIDEQSWDNNVKIVAKIPGLIAQMDADLDWTVQLGQAFVEQPMDLMNAIQALRAKAQAAGKLKTTAQQVVTTTNAVVERTYEGQVVYVTNTVIQVQPTSTEVVYVPSYNPAVVYTADPAVGFISFGVGIAFGAAFWGNCDWHYGGCYWGAYPPPPPPYPPPYHPPPGAPRPPPAGRPPGSVPPPGGVPPGSVPPGSRPPSVTPPGSRPPGSRPPGTQPPGTRPPSASTLPTQRWQPDQSRFSTFGAPSAATRDARGWGSAPTAPVQRPGTSSGISRPTPAQPIAPGGTRPSTVPSTPGNWPGGAARPAPSPGVTRPSPTWQQPSAGRFTPGPGGGGGVRYPSSPSVGRPGGQPSSAFSGVNSGSGARNYSSRGAASRSGVGLHGGGGRGR